MLIAIPISKVCLIPKAGIKNNPLNNAPNTVPSVLIEKTFPIDTPIFFCEAENISTIRGRFIPIKTVGVISILKQIKN